MELQNKENIRYLLVDKSNVDKYGFTCIKNRKSEGFKRKLSWFNKTRAGSVNIIVALDEDDRQLGFVEYMAGEEAWKPVSAKNWYFIQCMATMSKKDRNTGIASELIELCFAEALKNNKKGVCTMTSKGVWLPDQSLFKKNGYDEVGTRGRFELLVKKTDSSFENPNLIDWEEKQKKYKGWHLLYADQCPWHIKSVEDMCNAALDMDIELIVKEIKSPKEAQNGPSGFGTFALLKDGKLLSDHYLSTSRFRNIVKEEKQII